MAYQLEGIKADDPSITKLYGERTASTSCQYFLQHISKSSNILDVGCGPGTITSDLAKLASEGKTIGVDNSAGIIAQAQANYAATTPNLSFTVGDATDLSAYPDNSFDIVHAHQLLIHLPGASSIQALGEFRRVCKPGGFVAVRESDVSVIVSLKPDLAPLHDFWGRSVSVMEKIGAHPRAGRELAGWAKEAGWGGGEGGKMVVTESLISNAGHGERCKGEAAEQAVKFGMATKEEMETWAAAWDEWSAAEGHEFVFKAIEVICWKGK